MNRFLFLAFVLIMLAACSNKQLYQVGQDYQKSECIRNAVTESQHNDCLNLDKNPTKNMKKSVKKLLKNNTREVLIKSNS